MPSKSSDLTRFTGTDKNISAGTKTGTRADSRTARRNNQGSRTGTRTARGTSTDLSSSTGVQVQAGLVEGEELQKAHVKRSKVSGGGQQTVTQEDFVLRILFSLPLAEGPGKNVML